MLPGKVIPVILVHDIPLFDLHKVTAADVVSYAENSQYVPFQPIA